MKRLGTGWGLIGVALLLIGAIYRLAPMALEAFAYPFAWYHWAGLVISTALMAYLEGYRSFQKGLSARVVARAKYLGQDPNWRHHLLAPLFCLGYFYATPKRKRTAYTVLGMIIGFIWLVRQLDQPWRGIVDVGVIVGLSWGLGSFIWYGVQAFTKPDFNVSPEVPDLRPEVRLGDRPRLVFTPVVPDDDQAEPPNQANSFSPAD